MKLTNEIIESGKTERGAWTRAQFLILGIEWPPKGGWKGRIIGCEYSEETVKKFRDAAGKFAARTLKSHRKENRSPDSQNGSSVSELERTVEMLAERVDTLECRVERLEGMQCRKNSET